MLRDPQSHKGENGKVAIIGGSRNQHGAPIFSGLAAQASGVNLLYIFVPYQHEEVAKHAALNFQVHGFGTEKELSDTPSDELLAKDLALILNLLATMDCAVIGPGLSRTAANLKVIQELIAQSPCPLIIDASALQPFTLKAAAGKKCVLTPHLGELERMGIDQADLNATAKKYLTTIFLKGATDQIASETGDIKMIDGGNAGLTHGGTGDALAGLICGLIAQKMDAFEACILAGTIMKRAGTILAETKGFAYTTEEVIELMPGLLGSFH